MAMETCALPTVLGRPGPVGTPVDSSQGNWVSVAISCSGEFQVAVAKEGGPVCTWMSSDYGRT